MSIMARHWSNTSEEEKQVWKYRAEQLKDQNNTNSAATNVGGGNTTTATGTAAAASNNNNNTDHPVTVPQQLGISELDLINFQDPLSVSDENIAAGGGSGGGGGTNAKKRGAKKERRD